MRNLVFGLLGAATLGLSAFAAQPASAQPYRPGLDVAPALETVQYRRYYHGPRYGPRYGYYGYGRPYRRYRRVYGPRRCWVRTERVFNGYVWVRRPVRICR